MLRHVMATFDDLKDPAIQDLMQQGLEDCEGALRAER